MEHSLAASPKGNLKRPCDPATPLLERKESGRLQHDSLANAHSSVIQNSPEAETPQVSISGWMTTDGETERGPFPRQVPARSEKRMKRRYLLQAGEL